MQEYSMFERLPFRSQTETLQREGICIAKRRVKQWTVALYTYQNGFVEVWSDKEIEVISTFKASAKAMDILAPYADDVDVQEILTGDE